MSQEKNNANAQRWLLQAQADIRAAERSRADNSCEWACFQSQQAGEKALKALWYTRGLDPWGHSLVRLVQDFPADRGKERLLPHLQSAKALDKLYIPTRYPNGLPDLIPAEVFTAPEAQDAIAHARAIIDFVRGEIVRSA